MVNLKACERCSKFEPTSDLDISNNTVKSPGIILNCNGDWGNHFGREMGKLRFDENNKALITFNKKFQIPSDCEYKLEQTV